MTTNLPAYRRHLSIDTTSFRVVAPGVAANRDNAIPRSSYLFGASWPQVCGIPACRLRPLCGPDFAAILYCLMAQSKRELEDV